METCFDGYAYITEECLGVFRMDKPIVPAKLAVQIMKHPNFHIILITTIWCRWLC